MALYIPSNENVYEPTEHALAPAPDMQKFDGEITREEVFPVKNEEWKNGAAFLLLNFLTPEECIYFRGQADHFGMMDSGYPKNYRNCRKVTCYSKEVAALLFDRVKAHLAAVNAHGDHWKPTHLNPTFRICKYRPGGHFSPHYDGGFDESRDSVSMLTFMIYLNGDFQGGGTNFLRPISICEKERDENNRIVASASSVVATVQPKAGTVVVFQHRGMYHEGARLESGEKWIMRSECMFTRQPRAPKESDGEI